MFVLTEKSNRFVVAHESLINHQRNAVTRHYISHRQLFAGFAINQKKIAARLKSRA